MPRSKLRPHCAILHQNFSTATNWPTSIGLFVSHCARLTVARIFQTAARLLVAGWALTGHAYGEAPKAGETATIEGEVLYQERMLLPADAQIEISLQEVAKMDVAADVISTLRFQPEDGPPFAFSLEYDPSRIHSRGRYAIRARIDANGKLLFATTEHIGAFDAQPGEPVDVMVSRIPERPRTR